MTGKTMTGKGARTGLQLRSLVKPDGELEISLVDVEVPAPGPDEVVIRIEASPINPSDLGMLFGSADLSTVHAAGTAERPVVTARIPDAGLKAMAARIGKALQVGNEGAGTVVAAGTSQDAQALLGRLVAVYPWGGMYGQYRVVRADQCLPLPKGTRAIDAASCFVNPLTALGMVETMRREGHRALVHTAAASNLGQMLVRLCIEEDIALVNIVRRPEQAALLRSIGAQWVCDQSSPGFENELVDALAATGATIAFDAIGGGTLANRILDCMERAISRDAKGFNRYGSTVHKQVYLYGALDPGPVEIRRSFGMAWGIGGWLMPTFLERIGPAAAQRLRERVVAGLTTTFVSTYSKQVSLAEMLQPDEIAVYGKRSTGAKYLILPNG